MIFLEIDDVEPCCDCSGGGGGDCDGIFCGAVWFCWKKKAFTSSKRFSRWIVQTIQSVNLILIFLPSLSLSHTKQFPSNEQSTIDINNKNRMAQLIKWVDKLSSYLNRTFWPRPKYTLILGFNFDGYANRYVYIL